MLRNFGALILFISFSLNAAEPKIFSKLPVCAKPDESKSTSKEQIASWSNCFGNYKFILDDEFKGNHYLGEFKNGLPDGKDVCRW